MRKLFLFRKNIPTVYYYMKTQIEGTGKHEIYVVDTSTVNLCMSVQDPTN